MNNIAWALRHLPVFGVFGDGSYRLQPIYVEDLAELAVRHGAGRENLTIDAIGPETFTYRELAQTIRQALKLRTPIIGVPKRIGYLVGKLVGWWVHDEMVTWEEILGLTANLLCVESPPAGSTRLTDWITAHAATLGLRYASELAAQGSVDRVSDELTGISTRAGTGRRAWSVTRSVSEDPGMTLTAPCGWRRGPDRHRESPVVQRAERLPQPGRDRGLGRHPGDDRQGEDRRGAVAATRIAPLPPRRACHYGTHFEQPDINVKSARRLVAVDGDDVLSGVQGRHRLGRDLEVVEGEGIIPAAVRSQFAAFEVHGGLPIHGSELQQEALGLPLLGHREVAAIPQPLVGHHLRHFALLVRMPSHRAASQPA